MSEQKTYWFKIEGKLYAEDKEEAYDQLHNMAIAGENCERAFYELTEDIE
jgi:hypothetical protein